MDTPPDTATADDAAQWPNGRPSRKKIPDDPDGRARRHAALSAILLDRRLTRSDLCRMHGVDSTALWHWVRRGDPHAISRTVRTDGSGPVTTALLAAILDVPESALDADRGVPLPPKTGRRRYPSARRLAAESAASATPPSTEPEAP